MGLPEFLVLKHNLLQVLKRYDHGIDLAKFAQLEKLNGADFLPVGGEVSEYCKIGN